MFDKFKNGLKYSRKELNKVIAEVERQGKVFVDGNAVNDSGGLQIGSEDLGFYAMLLSDSTDCTGNLFPYAWEEIVPDGEGGWNLLDNPRTGTETQNPAYSTKGECLDSGSLVWLKYGIHEEMLFDDCCGTASAVCVPYLEDSTTTRTLGYGSETLASCDEDCENCASSNCVKYLSDVLCVGSSRTDITRWLTWTTEGFYVCTNDDCSSCFDPVTCVPFVESAVCVGNDLVVTKKFFIWNEGGFTVEDEDCESTGCCYTATTAVTDVGAALVDSDTIDFTASTTITADVKNDSITLAKIVEIATDNLIGRATAGTGNPELIPCTAAGRALLDDVDAAAQRTTLGLGTLATQSGTFSGTSSGTNTGDQTITLTSDVTGSGTGSFATTIANNAVTLAKMAQMATASILGRDTAGTGNVEVLSTSTAKTMLGLTGTNSGDQTITLTSDVTGSGTGSFATTIANNAVTLAKMAQMATASFLGRNTASTGNVEVLSTSTAKTMLGLTGTNSGDQTITLTSDVTGSGTGSFATTIANDAVTYAKMQNVSAASKLIGRGDSGSGDPQEITLGTNLSMSGTTLNVSGASEATSAEMEAASSTTAFVSPSKFIHHPLSPKAWVRFQGVSTVTIIASYGVSSIGDNGNGNFSVNFSTYFSSTNYVPLVSTTHATTVDCFAEFDNATISTSGIKVFVIAYQTGALTDPNWVSVMAFGDQ